MSDVREVQTKPRGRPRRSQLIGPAGVLLLACGLAGCGDGARTAPRSALSLLQATTGAAKTAVDPSGNFVFSPPSPRVGAPPEITQQQAEALASALLSQFGSQMLVTLQKEHGDTIILAELTKCHRTLYARAPYVPLDPAFVTSNPEVGAQQRIHGPAWLVPFCDHTGGLSVLVAVASYDTDLSLQDGQLILPLTGGGWFGWHGIPEGQQAELAVGPEEAALLAARLTGRLVTAVPELIQPERRQGFAWDSRWRIPLDAATTVALQATRQARQTAELFVGYRPLREGGTIDVPDSAQPDGDRFRYRTNVQVGQPPPTQIVWADGFVKRDSTTPIAFDVVTTTAAMATGPN